jgi:hypothetical protein
MKKTISIIFFISISLMSFAQSEFDKALDEISSDLANKLSRKEKKKVVVLYITDINKATTVTGTYLADIISYNFVNDMANFQVFDRDNLSGIAEVNKLIAEGYIDIDKVKELGKLLFVEAIIIGKYTVLSNTIKLTLKALDSSNGFVIAASIKDLPLDGDAGALLGINVSSASGTNINNSNRGFNRPIQSGESYNNPETVSKECETKNTGDYCFENSSKTKILVYTFYSQMYLDPGQTQCFYNKKAGNYSYQIRKTDTRGRYITTGSGEILVEKCKSKTFQIK